MLRTAVQPARHCCKRLLTSPRDAPLLNMEQLRTTMIMEHKYTPPMGKIGCLPKFHEREMVFNVVERVHDKRTPDITCILTDFVEGVGVRGDTVTIKRKLFRNTLFPAGLAVYASPENVQKFAEEKATRGEEEEKRLGVFGEMALRQLPGLYLRVLMSGDNHWVLTPKHVRIALRMAGVEATEESILLPQEPIVQPGEFNFRITINGAKSAMVKGRVLLRHNDPSKTEWIEELPPTWPPAEEGKRTSYLEDYC